MLSRGDARTGDVRIAWSQLGMIALGVAAIGLADIAGGFGQSAGLTLAGVGVLLAMVWYDERAAVRLLPNGAGSLSAAPGAGYATMFLLTAASMGYSVYGPAILQKLGGLSALTAGYVVAIEAVAWTLCALAVSHLEGPWPGRMIRLGAVCATLGVGLSAVAFPAASVIGVLLAGAALGGGFGLSWSFMSQRVLAALSGEERGVGAAGMTTVRLTGSAAGAAMAAAVANLLGFSHGLSGHAARSAGVWVFVSVLPVAVLGLWTAWRLAADRHAVAPSPETVDDGLVPDGQELRLSPGHGVVDQGYEGRPDPDDRR